MGTFEPAATMAGSDSLEWARTIAKIDQAELVTQRPWATTHRLSGAAGSFYLKVLPKVQARMLSSLAALTAHFPQQLPRIVALDAKRGWLLTEDHGGRGLDYYSPSDDIVTLIKAYATLQIQAAKSPSLFAGLPMPALSTLPEQLLEFLKFSTASSARSTRRVGAGYFIGADKAEDLHDRFERRLSLLNQHLKAAGELPLTINHGDLRPLNAGITDMGQCVIVDWDDAMVGPAGMSLQGIFGGCCIATILLSGSAAAKAAADTPYGSQIHAYVDTLAQGGYADLATLKRAVPATMCAGMIQFILNFAKYPSEDARLDVAETLETLLDDLLNVCDLLASREPQTALELAQDYEQHEYYERAERMLNDYLLRQPADVDVLARLASMQRKNRSLDDAATTYRQAIKLAPQRATLRAGLAAVLSDRLSIAASKREFKKALQLDPALDVARAGLGRLASIEQMQRDATKPDRMPILRYTSEDLQSGVVTPEMLALGAAMFETYGTVQIDNAFPPAMIERLQEAFFARYSPYFRDAEHPDALYLGDKRYMLTVDMEQPFNAAELIGAPMVLPIIRKILGDECVLGAYTAVISLPGSKDQRLHKDHTPLFPNTPWHHTVPSFAAQIIIPLVPLNEMTGTTQFYKGSHRLTTDKSEALGAQDPVLPLGSCLLNDYRVAHRGLGNRSQQVRPILTLIFNRRWFRDFKNYEKQPPIRLSDKGYSELPADVKRLFSVWKEERSHSKLMRSQLL